MTVLRWDDATRAELNSILPDALVLVAVGATEQHGPHLPAGTDTFLSRIVLDRAVERAAGSSPRPLVLAAPLSIGASDHHHRFGGTLSLRPSTMIMVLADLLDSVVAAGGRRVVIVNGHGGNVGVCHAAAAAAAARTDLAVAVINYWQLVDDDPGAPGPIPGHAGWFETSLMLAVRPDLVAERTCREEPDPVIAPPDVDLHSAAAWTAVDGYTDRPDLGNTVAGRQLLENIVTQLSNRIVRTAEILA